MAYLISWGRALTIQRLALAALAWLLLALAMRVPLDTDTGWHLRAGEYFLHTGDILREDTFSYTRYGADWINHSWGGQVILVLAYRTGGQLGLALYTACFALGGMALVYRLGAGTVYSRAFVMIIGAATAATFWSARPQMLSFFLSALVLTLLYDYQAGRERRLWAFPLVMGLWVNLHAGYIAGIILWLGFLLGQGVGSVLAPAQHLDRERLARVGLVGLLGILALALNPYGPRMWVYPFETAQLQALNQFIAEWQTPDFGQLTMAPFGVLLLGILALALTTRHVFTWSDASLVCGTTLLALWAGRNVALFALVATPVLMRLLDAFLRERGWEIQPTQKMGNARAALNWALLSLIALAVLGKIALDFQPETLRTARAEQLPLAALDYLAESPPPEPMLNDYNWGGLLIWHQPARRVFVDGRTVLYGDAFLLDYFAAYLGASTWRDLLQRYDIQSAFLPRENALTTLLRQDPAWRIVYEDEQAAILERRAE